MNNPATIRARRDFVTNSTFMELNAIFEETIQKETHALTNDALRNDITQVNTRAGSVEGMKMLVGLMNQFREQALGDFVETRMPENGP